MKTNKFTVIVGRLPTGENKSFRMSGWYGQASVSREASKRKMTNVSYTYNRHVSISRGVVEYARYDLN